MKINKRFDQTLYDEYDDRGREYAKSLFKCINVTLEDNPDQYGVDLLAYYQGQLIGYVEVEVRTIWKGDKFTFDTLNIPCRKEKLLKNPLTSYVVSFNNDGTRAFICKDVDILASDIREAKNKYMAEAEYFFKVPLDKIKLVKIGE